LQGALAQRAARAERFLSPVTLRKKSKICPPGKICARGEVPYERRGEVVRAPDGGWLRPRCSCHQHSWPDSAPAPRKAGDVARAVFFLAQNDSLRGPTIAVDGGRGLAE